MSYKPFEWKDLGDISTGRTNLGPEMPVAVYRLFEFTTKDVLTRRYGAETAKEIIRECGFIAGSEFYKNVIQEDNLTFDNFISKLQKAILQYKIGVLRIESADIARKRITLTVAEDIDCSGLDVADEAVCNYDEGFIAGILKCYTGCDWDVLEIDCWATGDRVCRFKAIGR
ncbi:MAG: 4-vinyl reductase [Christensenellaceae bacterium]|nr:4-vinyl reductase [Christensenellaceae bacterium]